MKAKIRKGGILKLIGLLFIFTALYIASYNLWEEERAGKMSEDIVCQLEGKINRNFEEKKEGLSDSDVPDISGSSETDPQGNGNVVQTEDNGPEYLKNPDVNMPAIEIDGSNYIGFLEIPRLSLRLPVIEEWSYPKLKIAPCRYSGTVYAGNMIIAAHNYAKHFGKIKSLEIGDEVIFTDISGNIFLYNVWETDVLKNQETDEMRSGNWDLTLFTCTMDGRKRITVRCKKLI